MRHYNVSFRSLKAAVNHLNNIVTSQHETLSHAALVDAEYMFLFGQFLDIQADQREFVVPNMVHVL
jgi:hypothetical protein